MTSLIFVILTFLFVILTFLFVILTSPLVILRAKPEELKTIEILRKAQNDKAKVEILRLTPQNDT